MRVLWAKIQKKKKKKKIHSYLAYQNIPALKVNAYLRIKADIW